MTRCDLCLSDATAVLYVEEVGRVCLDCCAMAVRSNVSGMRMYIAGKRLADEIASTSDRLFYPGGRHGSRGGEGRSGD